MRPEYIKIITNRLKHPQVKSAFVVDGVNFAPACIEVWLHKLISQKIKTKPAPGNLAQYFQEITRLFLHHPKVVYRYLWQLFARAAFSSPNPDILVFSNGLHLASYASLIKTLDRRIKLRVVTDRQAPLDWFYLSQYHLYPQALEIPTALNQYILHQLQAQLSHVPKLPRFLTSEFLPRFLKKYQQADQLVGKLKPKLVITTHEPGPSAMAFVMAAKKFNIKTLVLQHGIPSEGGYFFSDHQLVWGTRVKQFISDQGIPKRKLILGGQPIFYDYQQYFQKHSKIQSSSEQIGVVLSGYGTNQPHQVKYVQQLKKRLANYKLVFRLHPGQYLDDLPLSSINLGQTIEEFIASSDIIITQTSTATVIAALSNTPVIYFPAFHPFLTQGVLWKYKAFSPVVTAAQASKRVNQLQDPKFRQQYLQKQHQQVLEYTGPISRTLGEDLAIKILKLL